MPLRFILLPFMLAVGTGAALSPICNALANERVAQTLESPQIQKRPKIALVLSGGGARGAAHVGVIKELERLRVPIDLIVGTSMGALIGASYASGTSIAELEERIANADWNDLLTDASPREDRSFLRKEEDQARLLKLEMGVKGLNVQLPRGAVSGQKLDILFSRITNRAPGEVAFDTLAIPFRAIATDAETGKMHVFSRGRLASVMRASMSVPGAVAPVEIGDQLFLDGGLTRNLPIDVARELGADVVIAVNIGSPLLKRSEIQNVLGVSLQMINILTEQNVRASLDSLREQDVLISPNLDTIGASDFHLATLAVKAGAEATLALQERLQRFAVSPIIFAQRRRTQLARAGELLPPSAKIDELAVQGLERANESELRRTLGVAVGDNADESRINAGISRVFGMGYFERVNYSLLNEGGRRRLVVDVREKSWGPHYLRVGIAMAADSVGEGRFNLLFRSQQTQVNSAGAEWRNDLQVGRDQRFASRFFQPFGAGSIVNVAPGIEFAKRPIDIYSGERRIAQYEVTSSVSSIDFGVDISRNAIARLGFLRGNDDAQINIGTPFAGEGKERKGGVRFVSQYDSLDSLDFPRQGRIFHLDYYASFRSFGSEREYRKLEVNYADHYSVGRHTFAVAARYGQNRGSQLPVFDQFSLGGFLQLSGYRPGELIGQSVALTRLGYYQRLNISPSFLGSNYYAGITAELGRVSNSFQSLASSNNRHSFGLFLGIESAFGPLYVGYGRAQDRSGVIYFFLGQP